jgi:hypothetical protein
MNILELDSYNLADAVKFNDRLNPKIWGPDEKMRPEVREQLLRIADDFREFLGINDLQLKDITVSGSNAAYTYTPHSDVDLHLVVDLPEADKSEVYRELFDAKKYQYNDMHNIKIGGYDVELYVQDANKPHHSQGIYSVVNNTWVDIPKRRQPEVNDISTQSKYEDLQQRIDVAIKSGDFDSMSALAEKIRDMRQAGLDAHGEFGPENLAFKMLRSQGKIKELYDARNAAKDQELSLKERRPARSVFTYGFKHEDVVNEVGLTPDGVSPETCMFLDSEQTEPTDEEILKDFIDFCAKELKLEHMPVIKLRRDPQWSVVHKTFGRYIDDKNLLEVAWGQRHIMDILRTVAHELTHRHQHEREEVPVTAGETGSEYENEANARAGVLMRDYARLHPEFFAQGQVEDLHGDEVHESASGYIPTKKQARDPRYSMALTVDIKPGQLGKEANKLKLKTDKQGHPQIANPNGLFEELKLQLEAFKRAREDYSPDNPPGPEFKPTMPAGTLRVDVSDVYDWYKIGNHISNMKGLGKHDFGKGPPSTIISFGDEDTEHEFINDLKATGLDVTDIDPKDLKKRPGKTIKTDPTYNVAENFADGKKPGDQIREKLNAWMNQDQQYEDPSQRAGFQAKVWPYIQQNIKTILADKGENGNGDYPAAPYAAWLLVQHMDAYPQNQIEFYNALKQAIPNHPKIQFLRDRAAVNQWIMKNANNPEYFIKGKALPNPTVNVRNPAIFKDAGIVATSREEALANAEQAGNKLLVAAVNATNAQTQPSYKQGVNEAQELDEVKMSPTALKKFADSPAAQGIQVGFEAEMIVPDVAADDADRDMEPDYDADERCRSVQQVIEFFEYDEYGYGISGREAEKLQERLDEAYFEWMDQQMMRDFREEAEDLIKKVMIDEKDWVQEDEVRKQLDMMEITGEDQEAVLAAGSRAPTFNSTKEQQAYAEEHPEYEKYAEALGEAEGLLDELVQDSVSAQDKYWDAAIDDFRDNYYVSDDSGFFDDVGLRYMSDVANRFDIYWPYMTFEEGEGSQDIDSVADDLSNALGMPVIASYSYHGAKRKPGEFIIEPDGSLSPDSSEDGGLEIISPPMPIAQAMEKLNQVISWAQARGCYTNSSTGLHMGVSLPGQRSFAEAEGDDIESATATEKPIDFMKLAVFLGDQYVLKEFGRSANSYCRSALEKLKEKRWSPTQIATAMEKMRGNLINLAYKDLADRSPGRDSINMKDNYVEFRGAGGDYLSRESNEGMDFLENTLLRYVQALAIAGDPNAYRDEYAKKLYKLISPEGDDTLNLFSQFATGEISSDQLKKDWAKRTLEKDDPGAIDKSNWVLVDIKSGQRVPGAEYNSYTKPEAYAKAREKYGASLTQTMFDMRYEIEPQNTGRWEIYRDDQGKEEQLEIIDSPTRGAAVDQAYETYTGVIPFKVRPYYGDEAAKPKPTPRASLARQIVQQPAEEVKNWIVYDTVTGEEHYNQPGRKSSLVQAMRKMEQDNKWPRGRLAIKLSDNQDIPPQEKDYNYEIVNLGDVNLGVVDKFYATDKQDADATFDKWLKMKGLPNDTSNYGYRPRKQEKEVKPNVAQNFAAQQGEQEVDGTGEPIWQIYQVGNGLVMSEITAADQQEAAQALQDQLDDWATDDDVRELYAVRPKMAEQSAQSTPPDATEQTGTWQIVDVTLNQPVETFQGTWAQAERIAQQYETGAGEHNGHEISVRRA